MTSKQIEIGNKLLAYFAVKGQDNTDNYFYHLTAECGFNSDEDIVEIGMTKEHLRRFDLIEPIGNGEYFWALTKEGMRASQIGIDNWLKKPSTGNHHSYNPVDKFSEEELNSINEKLDKLFNKLERLEVGQRLIYDDITAEIDGLKELTRVLGKRDWSQILKGKMIDWGLGKLSDEGFELLTSTFRFDKLLNG